MLGGRGIERPNDPLPLNDQTCFARVNGYHHSLKSARARASRSPCKRHRERESALALETHPRRRPNTNNMAAAMKAELQRQQADPKMLQEQAQLRLEKFLEQNPTIAAKLLELGMEKSSPGQFMNDQTSQSEERAP